MRFHISILLLLAAVAEYAIIETRNNRQTTYRGSFNASFRAALAREREISSKQPAA